MDKKEAIRLFVKRNSGVFKQNPFPWEVYKKLKHVFFVEQIKYPVPRDSEIASEILEGMIVSLQVKTAEDLEKILKLPFFDAKVVNKIYFRQKLDLKLKQSTPLLDVESIKRAEISEKIRDEIKAEAKREIIEGKDLEVQELEKKIHEKNEEYNSIQSVLDVANYPVPDAPEPIKPANQIFVPWWEKLGLREDPFRELEGLSRFDRSLYHKIVYKTDIFIKYESMARNSLSELFRNTVVYGRWGSGKTTFFNYMCSILDEFKVRPIYIQLCGEFEVRELIFDFVKNLSVELRKLYSIFAGEDSSSIDVVDDEQIIIELLKKLAYRGAKGFIIFIDDLHKGEDVKKAMRFLSYLQILSARIRRATDLNIGFFIAGSTDWEAEIKNNDKFLSSISRQEHMPPLEIDVALEAINKRLKAFAKNPENPRQIERSLVEKIYKALQPNPEEITFRRVMYELLNEFESDHFDALTANPIIISKSTLHGIHMLLESHTKTKVLLDGIVRNPKLTSYQKRRCLELLISLYLSNGLPDSEIIESDLPFMQQLKLAKLISKVMEKELVWKISEGLFSVNRKVISMYGLSLEDYLLKLYSEEIPIVAKAQKTKNREISQIDTLMFYFNNRLEGKYLNAAKLLHMKILDYREKYEDSSEYSEATIAEDCCESLAQLTMAYMTFEGIPIPRRTSLEKILFWKDFWWSPEVVLQFGRAIASDMENKRKIPLALSLYREAFPLVVDFFRNEYLNSELFYIHLSYLKNDEIKLFHECRHLWNDNQYREVAEMLTNAIDRKLKVFLYNIFSVLYGDYDNRIKLLDRDSRASICGNSQRDFGSSYSFAKNEYQRLNRHNYKNLMTGIEGSPDGRRNWKTIFSSVFLKWSEIDLYNYLTNIDTIVSRLMHTEDASLEEVERKLIYDLMMTSTTFIRSMNRLYINIITRIDYFKPQGAQVTFSLCTSVVDGFIQPIKLTSNDIKRIEDAFGGKNRIKVLFDDQQFVEGFFGLDYRKAYAAIALAYRGLNEKGEKADFKLHVLASKGPEIRLALSKTAKLESVPSSENGEETQKGISSDSKETSTVAPNEIKNNGTHIYDVFICHATEDKEPFVRELAAELSKTLRVWYDDFSLSLGDSLGRKIDQGISASRYGVVILSENFFKKDWPQKELDGLLAKEHNFDKVILPIWHGVSRDRVEIFSPTLAGRCAASSRKGIDYVVQEILRAINSQVNLY